MRSKAKARRVQSENGKLKIMIGLYPLTLALRYRYRPNVILCRIDKKYGQFAS